MLLRKLACIQAGTPVDSHSPHCAPSPAGSTGSIGSRAPFPPGGHILHTHSETPHRQRTGSAPAPCVVIAQTVMQLAVHLAVSQMENRMVRPTEVGLITQVVRNQMEILRNKMKVASKTMLKRWMGPAVMRLAVIPRAVKPRAVRCLPVRWPRAQSLSWILRTVKIHQTPTPGRPCPWFPHPRRRERRPNPVWHNCPHCHSWTQNCQKSSRR